MVVLAVVAIMMALLLPALSKARVKHHQKFECQNNLKQVGLGFRIWGIDNRDRLPMQVSTNDGGTREWIGGPNAWRHFEVMSNELHTPKVLFCPNETDSSRIQATVFGPVPRGVTGQVGFTGNSNLSYFVGVDAADTHTNKFLTGDRNITNGLPVTDGMLSLSTNEPTGWTGKIHRKRGRIWGNVAFADGRVESLETPRLRDVIRNAGVATNRLALP